MDVFKIAGIDHPSVAADDVEALADWYCAVFGYEKGVRTEKPVWMLKAPDSTLTSWIRREICCKLFKEIDYRRDGTCPVS